MNDGIWIGMSRKKENILFITGHPFKKECGTYTALYGLSEELAKTNRCNIEILGCGDKNKEEVLGGNVLYKSFKCGKLLISISFFSYLMRKIDRSTVIVMEGVWLTTVVIGYIVTKIRGGGYIVTPHGNLNRVAMKKSPIKKKIFKKIFLDKIVDGAKYVRVLSSTEKKRVDEIYPGKRIMVVPNLIDNLSEGEFKNESNVGYYLYVGRIDPIKNIELMIESWRRSVLSNKRCYKMLIAGSGEKDYVSSLKSMAEDVFNIEFIGYIEGKVKIDLIRGAKYVVLSSRSESLPMAILESFSCSTPVIVSDASGFENEEIDSCGYMFSDAEGFVRVLNDSSKVSEEIYSMLSEGAYFKYKEKYSKDKVVNKFLEMIEM